MSGAGFKDKHPKALLGKLVGNNCTADTGPDDDCIVERFGDGFLVHILQFYCVGMARCMAHTIISSES